MTRRRRLACAQAAGLALFAAYCATLSAGAAEPAGSAGLGLEARAGLALFKRQWVPAPASTEASDGLGPLYNARACTACHANGGGAQVITSPEGPDLKGAVVRFGDNSGGADPFYGVQLQTAAVPGLEAEGALRALPRPSFSLAGPALSPGIRAAVRVAPALYGIAALDRVPDAEILSRADDDDADGDGISGRGNRLPDGRLGRFGWKAAYATLRDQIAAAAALDIGLSSPRAPRAYGDCTARETACLSAPSGESPAFDGRELSETMLGLMAAYLDSLPRPAPAALNARATAGAALFASAGCAACHVPALKDDHGRPVVAFTDLLLHDMGPALDDGVGEAGVAPREWRTAPLVDLAPPGRVRRFLHDGRATTLTGAVALHGGEAARSRDAFRALPPQDKARLIGYLKRL